MRQHICDILKSGLLAGTISAAISFLLNFYLLPFPATLLENASGHGVGGFISGFISACLGIVVFIFHHKSKAASLSANGGVTNGYSE